MSLISAQEILSSLLTVYIDLSHTLHKAHNPVINLLPDLEIAVYLVVVTGLHPELGYQNCLPACCNPGDYCTRARQAALNLLD